MHEKLAQLTNAKCIAVMTPTAQRVMLAWLVDHPMRHTPNLKRTQAVLTVSRATAYRGISELRRTACAIEQHGERALNRADASIIA